MPFFSLANFIKNSIVKSASLTSLPKVEAKKVIDAIKSFSAFTNTITHSSKKTLEI